MIVDAHQHLWKYTSDQYGWIDERMQALARDFSVDDLRQAAANTGVTGSVVVQARQTLEETEWLLDLAEQHDFLLGVIGWAPLAGNDLPRVIDRYASRQKLKGFRHVVHDEPDDDFILGDEFNRGVSAVIERGYAYDILVFERHLPQAIEFATRHSSGRLVVDHIAKPRIAVAEVEPWRQNLRELARRENVTCKLSGVVSEAAWDDWTLDSIRPYLDSVLEAFGPSRLMFGSDWPVCLLACTYQRWFETISEWAAPLADSERTWLFAQTVRLTYRLDGM